MPTIWGATGFDQQISFAGNVFAQRVGEPRFANPRLATKQHDLAMSFFDLFPTVKQKSDFLVSADRRGECRFASQE